MNRTTLTSVATFASTECERPPRPFVVSPFSCLSLHARVQRTVLETLTCRAIGEVSNNSEPHLIDRSDLWQAAADALGRLGLNRWKVWYPDEEPETVFDHAPAIAGHSWLFLVGA